MELTNHRLAVNTIENTNELGFSAEDYSRFKYGDHEVARRFGASLFNYFRNELLNTILEEEDHLIVYSSPYTYLPTSSLHMTRHFYELLSEYIEKDSGLSLMLEFGKIERCQTYSEDYGSMSAQERYELIKNDTYKLVDNPSEKAKLIFIDDISITGTHQVVIEKLLKENDVRNKAYYYYFAKLENKLVDPTFENELNYAYVKGVNELIEILLSQEFKNTTRTTKYILQLKENELFELIGSMEVNDRLDVLKDVFFGALKNNYSDMTSYRKNLDILARRLNLEPVTF